MKHRNLIVEAAKAQWIPADELLPGEMQYIFFLTADGRTGSGYFFRKDLTAGCWTYFDSTVLYWWPVVEDMPGVTVGGWRKQREEQKHD